MAEPQSTPEDEIEPIRKHFQNGRIDCALELALPIARAGHGAGQYWASRCFAPRLGSLRNPRLADYWMRKAHETSSDVVLLEQTQEGAMLYYDGLYDSALQLLRRAARANIPDAQFYAARCYERRKGSSKGDRLARYWTERAAENGHDTAQANLGRRFLNGTGVRQNYKRARMWLQAAASRDNRRAQTLLGFMYLKGLGVLQNWCAHFIFINLRTTRTIHMRARHLDGSTRKGTLSRATSLARSNCMKQRVEEEIRMAPTIWGASI